MNPLTLEKSNKVIYVIENENGRIKIGVASNPNIRKSTIQNIGGYKVVKMFCTPSCSNPYEVEKTLHNLFISQRKCGEWFDVDFNTAVEAAKKVFSKQAECKRLYEKSGVAIFDTINQMFDGAISSEREGKKSIELSGAVEDVTNLIKELSLIMKAQNNSPLEIALMVKEICKQFDVIVPIAQQSLMELGGVNRD